MGPWPAPGSWIFEQLFKCVSLEYKNKRDRILRYILDHPLYLIRDAIIIKQYNANSHLPEDFDDYISSLPFTIKWEKNFSTKTQVIKKILNLNVQKRKWLIRDTHLLTNMERCLDNMQIQEHDQLMKILKPDLEIFFDSIKEKVLIHLDQMIETQEFLIMQDSYSFPESILAYIFDQYVPKQKDYRKYLDHSTLLRVEERVHECIRDQNVHKNDHACKKVNDTLHKTQQKQSRIQNQMTNAQNDNRISQEELGTEANKQDLSLIDLKKQMDLLITMQQQLNDGLQFLKNFQINPSQTDCTEEIIGGVGTAGSKSGVLPGLDFVDILSTEDANYIPNCGNQDGITNDTQSHLDVVLSETSDSDIPNNQLANKQTIQNEYNLDHEIRISDSNPMFDFSQMKAKYTLKKGGQIDVETYSPEQHDLNDQNIHVHSQANRETWSILDKPGARILIITDSTGLSFQGFGNEVSIQVFPGMRMKNLRIVLENFLPWLGLFSIVASVGTNDKISQSIEEELVNVYDWGKQNIPEFYFLGINTNREGLNDAGIQKINENILNTFSDGYIEPINASHVKFIKTKANVENGMPCSKTAYTLSTGTKIVENIIKKLNLLN